MRLFVFAEPAAWEIKNYYNNKPQQVNPAKVISKRWRPEQKWRFKGVNKQPLKI